MEDVEHAVGEYERAGKGVDARLQLRRIADL
jgi:hypothetical protein